MVSAMTGQCSRCITTSGDQAMLPLGSKRIDTMLADMGLRPFVNCPSYHADWLSGIGA